MKVISNTGPLIGLAKTGRLFLLKSLFKEVLIPPMVHRELLGKCGNESEQIDSALQDFIQVTKLKPVAPETEAVVADLDEGEKQAISLASSIEGDVLLLLDDRAGREAAGIIKIPTTGLIGILLLAKEKGLVENIKPLIEETRNSGYWLSDEVFDIALRLAKE